LADLRKTGCGPNRRLLGFAGILTRITVKCSRTL